MLIKAPREGIARKTSLEVPQQMKPAVFQHERKREKAPNKALHVHAVAMMTALSSEIIKANVIASIREDD